jgi:hypothetical protein
MERRWNRGREPFRLFRFVPFLFQLPKVAQTRMNKGLFRLFRFNRDYGQQNRAIRPTRTSTRRACCECR